MLADLGLGLANHGCQACQVSVFNFQFSSAALPPTIGDLGGSRIDHHAITFNPVIRDK